MKHSSIFLTGLGLLAGFVTGYTIHEQSETEKTIPQAASESSELARIPNPELSREQTLLLQSIDLLDLTTAELEDAKAYIHKLERKTKRYNWLLDYWKEKGFGNSYQMAFGLHRELSFEPTTDLKEFFGWDPGQVHAMTQIGQTTADAILDWERGHSSCIEETETNMVYRIDPMPEEIMLNYMQAMEDILETDDMELLRKKLEDKFRGMQSERTLSITIGPPPPGHVPSEYANPEQQWMKVEVKASNPANPMIALGGSYTSYSVYHAGQTTDPRWNHVFNMEWNKPDMPRNRYVPAP